MALSHRRRFESVNYWPGFVDALSTMLLVIIFLLSVFMLAQFFLSREVTGKDTALAKLNQQIEELTSLLALERSQKSEDQTKIASLTATLEASQSERQHLLDAAAEGGAGAEAEKDRATAAANALDAQRQISAKALAQVDILNQQISALRKQLAAIQEALEASESSGREAQAKIADLGQRLNVALAQKVQELARYRSDFFGRLRQILGQRPDIRVVGDRFVFESSVLFESAKADISPAGKQSLELARRRGARSRARDSARYSLDSARRRPHRFEGDLRRAVQVELGIVGGARDRRRAIPHLQGHRTDPPRRRRLRRIPADRSRHGRRSPRPQPPHRAETDRKVGQGGGAARRRA